MKLSATTPNKLSLLLFCVILAALLFRNAWVGPDYSRYHQWSEAAASGDIFMLRGNFSSPLGVPLSQWSSGPGFLYALPKLVFKAENHLPPLLLRWIGRTSWSGWIAAITLWLSLFGIVNVLTDKNNPLTFLILGAAFLGTHLGYYSVFHGSESLSYGCFALMVYWVLTTRRWNGFDVLMTAVLGALLVLIQTQLILYATLAVVVMVHRILFSKEELSKRKASFFFLILIVPFILVFIHLAYVNRWMTGEWTSSPYIFGGEGFRSLDFLNPEFGAVLAHPWHGLLAYHPLYLAAFPILLLGIFRRNPASKRWLYSACLTVLVLHVYLQASWYCWWLGTGTFGMRGLGIGAIILVPLLADTLQRRKARGKSDLGLLLFMVAASLWSYLLMLQGNSNYLTFSELIRAQAAYLLRMDFLLPVAGFAVFSTFYFGRRDRRATGLTGGAACFLSSLSLYYLFQLEFQPSGPFPALLVRCAALILTGIITAGTVNLPGRDARLAGGWKYLPIAAVLSAFIVINILFFRLAIATEKYISEGSRPPGRFLYVSKVHFHEVEESYREYLQVPGFERKKSALRKYLESCR